MLKKLQAAIKICRPLNVLITFVTIYVAGIISQKSSYTTIEIFFASISGAFLAAGGYIINDYYDLVSDKINRPDRVLPKSELNNSTVILLYFLFTLTAFILAFFINVQAFIIILFAAFSLYLYSWKIKRVIFVGNFLIAILTGLVFIYGGISVNYIENAFVPAGFAFLINLIRELLKDIEDIEGDKAAGIFTLPIKYGISSSIKLIFIFSIILILSTTIPFFTKIYSIEYFITVMLTVNLLLVYFLKNILSDYSKNNLGKMSKLLKLSMVFGLIAIYLGN